MKMKRRRDEERVRDIRSMKREREREEIFSYKDKDKRAETHTSSSSSSTLILGPREAVRFSVTMATNPWPKKQRIVGRFSFFFFFLVASQLDEDGNKICFLMCFCFCSLSSSTICKTENVNKLTYLVYTVSSSCIDYRAQAEL